MWGWGQPGVLVTLKTIMVSVTFIKCFLCMRLCASLFCLMQWTELNRSRG